MTDFYRFFVEPGGTQYCFFHVAYIKFYSKALLSDMMRSCDPREGRMAKQSRKISPPRPAAAPRRTARTPRAYSPDVEKINCRVAEAQAIFANAKRMAGMVARTLGPFCEVAVHDFSDLEHSIIHIEGSLTGRNVGAPATNMVTKAWRQGGDNVQDIIAYAATTPSGQTLKSSISFLRTSEGEVIGAVCIHFDLTDLERFQGVLHALLRFENAPGKEMSEAFPSCLGETSDAIIETAIRRAGKHPATMTREEKLNFVRIMDEEGAFLIKGMVQYLAKAMRVSIYTVYNYMRQVKDDANRETSANCNSAASQRQRANGCKRPRRLTSGLPAWSILPLKKCKCSNAAFSCCAPQRGVDSAANRIFHLNENFEMLLISKLICPRCPG